MSDPVSPLAHQSSSQLRIQSKPQLSYLSCEVLALNPAPKSAIEQATEAIDWQSVTLKSCEQSKDIEDVLIETVPASITLQVADKVILVKDANLLGQTVAIASRVAVASATSSVEIALTKPKALQLMTLTRAFKESVFFALPWLGMVVCFVFVLPVFFANKKRQHKQPLKFTFSQNYYLLSSLLTLYPLLLMIFVEQGSGFIMPMMIVIYFILTGLNMHQTVKRNANVTKYNVDILARSRSFIVD